MNLQPKGDEETKGYKDISGDKADKTKVQDTGCTPLLIFLCIFNFFLKAAYSIWPPFLPAEALDKGVNQEYIGIMFCIYSVAFAVVSPLVGKYIPVVGRRNFLVIGWALMIFANLGFAFMHYVNNSTVFTVLFVAMRIIQGIGTGIIQTTNYSIVSFVYESRVEFAIGLLESAAGFGLCFGPILGIGLLKIGGYFGSFLTFAIIFFLFAIVIRPSLPSNIDRAIDDEEEVDTSKYSYFTLLSNRRVLFANLCVILNIAQYTFIDPILSDRMNQDFGLDVKFTSLMFFFIGFGYSGTCNIVHKTLEIISRRRWIILFFLVNGFCTFLYGPIDIFSIPKSIYIISIAMVIAGMSSAHTIIPAFPEMLAAGTEEAQIPKKVVNDLGAGLFNMNFAIGEVLGPLIGNQLYVTSGMEQTSNSIATFVIGFSLLYFLAWDKLMPWNKR